MMLQELAINRLVRLDRRIEFFQWHRQGSSRSAAVFLVNPVARDPNAHRLLRAGEPPADPRAPLLREQRPARQPHIRGGAHLHKEKGPTLPATSWQAGSREPRGEVPGA